MGAPEGGVMNGQLMGPELERRLLIGSLQRKSSVCSPALWRRREKEKEPHKLTLLVGLLLTSTLLPSFPTFFKTSQPHSIYTVRSIWSKPRHQLC